MDRTYGPSLLHNNNKACGPDKSDYPSSDDSDNDDSCPGLEDCSYTPGPPGSTVEAELNVEDNTDEDREDIYADIYADGDDSSELDKCHEPGSEPESQSPRDSPINICPSSSDINPASSVSSSNRSSPALSVNLDAINKLKIQKEVEKAIAGNHL